MRVATLDAVRLPGHSVRIMAELLTERGFDVGTALTSSGICAAIIDDPASEVSGQQELQFQRVFCGMTANDPELWLQLGKRYGLLSHAREVYGLAMATAPTVQDALEVAAQLGQYHCTLAQGHGLYVEGRRIGVRSNGDEVPGDLMLFTILRDIGINCRVYSELWGADFHYDRVALPISSRYDTLIRRYLPGATVQFGSQQNLWYYSTFVDERRPPLSDPVLHRYYRGQCEAMAGPTAKHDDIAAQLLVCAEKAGGQLTLGDAAAKLGTSIRSLQRRLARDGESFREIGLVARYNLACRKLRDGEQSIAEIAYEAGYEDLSSFYRAFRGRAGMAPGEYRRKSRC